VCLLDRTCDQQSFKLLGFGGMEVTPIPGRSCPSGAQHRRLLCPDWSILVVVVVADAEQPGTSAPGLVDPHLPGLQGTTPLSIQLAGLPGQPLQTPAAGGAAAEGAQPSDSMAMSAKHSVNPHHRPNTLHTALPQPPLPKTKQQPGAGMQMVQLQQRHIQGAGEDLGMGGDEGSALQGGLGHTGQARAAAAALTRQQHAEAMSDDDDSIGSTKKVGGQRAGSHRVVKQNQKKNRKPPRRPADLSESEGDFTPEVSDASMSGGGSEVISTGTLDDSEDDDGSDSGGGSAASGRPSAGHSRGRGVRATALASGFARPGAGAANKGPSAHTQPKHRSSNRGPAALADWSEEESPAEEEEEEPLSPTLGSSLGRGHRGGRQRVSEGGAGARSGAGRQRKRRALDPDFEYDASLLGEEGSEGEAGPPVRGRAVMGGGPSSPRGVAHTPAHGAGSKSVIKVTVKRPLNKEGSGDQTQAGLTSPGHAGPQGPLLELPPGAAPVPGFGRALPIKVKIRTHEGVGTQGPGLPSPTHRAATGLSPAGDGGPGGSQSLAQTALQPPHAGPGPGPGAGVIPQTDGAADECEEEEEQVANGHQAQAPAPPLASLTPPPAIATAGQPQTGSLHSRAPHTQATPQQAPGQPVTASQEAALPPPPVIQEPGSLHPPPGQSPLLSPRAQSAPDPPPQSQPQQQQPANGEAATAPAVVTQHTGPGAGGSQAQVLPVPTGPNSTPGTGTAEATTPAAAKAGVPGGKGGIAGMAPGAKRGTVKLSDAAPAATKAQGLVALGKCSTLCYYIRSGVVEM
jgi:hypothetical protein